MMKKSSLLAAAALSLMGTVSANAADLNPGSIKDGPVAYSQPAIASAARMYLRGDFSFANQDLGSIYEPPAYTLSSPTIDRTRGFGAGVGMYYGSNVRLDFTYDWRSNADVTGDIIDGAATVQGKRRFGVKSDVALFNVYYDFDAHARFKPYLGVGLGFSRNRTANGVIDIVYQPTDACGLPVPTATCSATFEGKTEWSAAGALMAGFSAKLHDRMHLDAGYRFLYLGDAHTGDVVITRNPVDPAAPAGAPDPKIFDLTAHEFRVGVRWDIK